MEFNFLITALAALIPLVIGAIWYNPKVLGTAWMRANNFSSDYKSKNKIGVIMLVSLLFNFFIAVVLSQLVVHQFGFFSTLMTDPTWNVEGSETYKFMIEFKERFYHNHRTFGHGALHGAFAAIFFVLPIIGTHALYESKSYKYVGIHFGYWLINFVLMGGLICQFV